MQMSAPPSTYDILIVDDNSDDREYYCRALRKEHDTIYQVTEAVDGEDGLARILANNFDCVLLDYSLPGTNGLDLLQTIRTTHPYLAVIMLTGQGDIQIAVNALKKGASDYLTKAPDLAERLHHAVMLAVQNAANAGRAERTSRYLRQMLDHIPDPIFMKDESYRFVDGNVAFWDFMKGSPDMFLGKTDHDVFPPEVADAWREVERALFDAESAAVREETSTRLAGEDVVLVTKKGVFRDLDDRKLLVGVIHDITAMKAQQEALEVSERTFRQAIENAVNGMAMVSPAGRWLKVNKALCQLLGYTEDDLLANDIASITHPDDREEDAHQLTDIWLEKEGVRQYEKRFMHFRGHVITVLQSVSLVRHPDGKPNYLVLQMADLTEARKMDRMKSEFVSTVSHELRTPLTSIRGSLGLVTQPFAAQLTDAGQELVEIAAENCERLIALINDILDIDKIASGEMRLDMKAHDVTVLIDQTIKANLGYADKFGITIERGDVPSNRYINVDQDRFVQILSNLISNGIKFSGESTHVNLSARETEAGTVRISVTDHGTGIPEEFRYRIFGKFAQADSSTARSKNGTGLGLHISRQLVERMNGTIGFDSEIGVGSTFWIEFEAMTPLVLARQKTSQPPGRRI